MNLRMQKPLFFYAASCLFLMVAITAVFIDHWWLVLLPLVTLLCIWAFEKPVFLFYLLIASIPWSIECQVSDTLGTDFPDEPLMLLNAMTALFFIAYKYKVFRRNALRQPIAVLLLLQLAWALLTVITSTYPLLSLKYVLAKNWYLFSFVLLPVLLLGTKERLKTTAVVLVSSMMLVVMVTVARHAAAGFRFAAINESLDPFFRNHVNYSALLVCVIPVLFLFLKRTTTRSLKTVVYILLLISLLALYVSYARGAWMALLTGITGYGLLKKKLLLPAFIAVILLIGAAVFWLQKDDRYLHYAHNYNKTIFHTDFEEHLVATYQLKDMSTAERFYRWVAGARMVKDGWKTGFGPNTFYVNYKHYTVPAFKTWVSANAEHSTVHNYFLLLLIEQGVFGLLLFLILLAIAFYNAQKLYHATTDVFWKGTIAAVAAILVMICTVNFLSDLIETDKVGSIFYLCLAVLMIAGTKINSKASQLATNIQGIT